MIYVRQYINFAVLVKTRWWWCKRNMLYLFWLFFPIDNFVINFVVLIYNIMDETHYLRIDKYFVALCYNLSIARFIMPFLHAVL